MKSLILNVLITLLAMPIINCAKADTLNYLEQLKWKHRILIIKSESACDQQPISTLTTNDFEVNDRDLIWFVFCDQEILTNYSATLSSHFKSDIEQTLSEQVDIKKGGPTILLIGKDGGAKHRTANLDLNNIFRIIDAMPMRQAEMQH